MLSRLLENWPYKLAAVIIAVALRFYVAAQLNPHKSETVPVRFTGIPSNLVLSTPQGWVHVDLSGPATDLATVRQSDIVAEVDLSSARAGKTASMPISIDLNHDLPPDVRGDIKLDGPTPATVAVTLEPLITQPRNVHVHFDRAAPIGSMYGKAILSPATVAVQGRQKVIDTIAMVTADVVSPDEGAGALRTSVSGDFDVVARGADGHTIDGVIINPAQVHVIVPVVKAASTKVVSINTAIIGSPADGGHVVSAIVKPSQVTISGPPDELANISSVMTRPVDISGEGGALTRKVELEIPNGVTRVGVDPIIVEITIVSPSSPAVSGLAATH